MAHTEDKNQRLGYWLAQYAADTGFSGSVQVISKGSVIFKKHLGFTDRENEHVTSWIDLCTAWMAQYVDNI